ncbi:PQQ-binding-like beta-propeller repeat protein [Nitrincola sp. MINF-07-Sa-05]|uniref:outer membrane protein assembly factor BamB family protein n=1 Tax=Nitrincola salilacus TaxID=3400273 RepID=UPI0039184BD2
MPEAKFTFIKHFFIWILIALGLCSFFYFYSNKQRLAYEIWQFPTLSFSTSPMVIYDNNLYFSDETNHLYSLSIEGTLNWKINLECPLHTKLIAIENFIAIETIAAYQTFYPEAVTNCRNEERLHIVDRLSGKIIDIKSSRKVYSYNIEENYIYYSTASILHKSNVNYSNVQNVLDMSRTDMRVGGFSSDFYIENSTLYMKSLYHDVYALDLNTHEFRWRFISDWNFEEKDTVNPHETSHSLIHDEGVIYTAHKIQHSTAADVYAFDAESGVILGRYRIEAGASPGRLSASDKYIYIPSRDSRVHALTKRDLYPVWDVPTIGPVRGAMVPYQGVVYAGTQAGSIIGLDEETGERVYRYPTDDPIPGTPAIQDGIIYFATNGGSIHAVKLPNK